MQKDKKVFSLPLIVLSIFLSNFVSPYSVFATPVITSFLLNGNAKSTTFNPNNSESVSIEVKANTAVKFTRLYICALDQICNGTSGNYTRYFTQTDISDTILKSWNGKKSGDIEVVPAGEYKIMVSMTEGINTPVLEFGQHSIFIDFGSVDVSGTSSNDSNINFISPTNNPTGVTHVTPTAYVSAHSSTEDLSDYDGETSFEISAGRERMALVGAPIEFNAKYDTLQTQCAPVFTWSFGDGFDASGSRIFHAYKYRGEYEVVLHGVCGGKNSISRTQVMAISPDIVISHLVNDDVEILNNNKVEINIGLWKIKGGQKDFIFPQDTIISAGKKIILSKDDFIIDSIIEKVSLYNPSDGEVTFFDIQDALSPLPNTFIPVVSQTSFIPVHKTNHISNNQENSILSVSDKNPTHIEIIQTASVLESTHSSSSISFWSKIIGIPVRGMKSFMHLFYDF